MIKFESLRKLGPRKWLKGRVHMLRNFFLQRVYGFDSWHITPIEFKEYAQYIVKSINSTSKELDTVVEIGCGLGDLIGNIQCRHGIGYDLDEKVIKGARRNHPKTRFVNGGFERVRLGGVDCLILVNVAHFTNPDYLIPALKEIFHENDVCFLVVDSLSEIENSEYEYSYDWEKILPKEGFRRVKRSESFAASNGAIRHIEYWKHIK